MIDHESYSAQIQIPYDGLEGSAGIQHVHQITAGRSPTPRARYKQQV